MKIRSPILIGLLMLITGIGFSQNAAIEHPSTTGEAAVQGVWRAEVDGLPAVTLVVSDEGGNLRGRFCSTS
jgi:hypothetical protein